MPDHAFFMAPGEEIITRRNLYLHPKGSEKLKKMKAISDPIEVAGYRIIPVPITHSLKVK